MTTPQFDYTKPADRARIIAALDKLQLARLVEYMADEKPQLFAEAIKYLADPD